MTALCRLIDAPIIPQIATKCNSVRSQWGQRRSIPSALSRLRVNRNDLTALCLSNLLVVEPNNCVVNVSSTLSYPQVIIKTPKMGVFIITGGDEGIRTLDTVAGILHFQCSALDQLCDVSGFCAWCYSADNSAVSSAWAASTPPSSTNVFSNSASISRNNGSSVAPTSNESSPSAADGASLYD